MSLVDAVRRWRAEANCVEPVVDKLVQRAEAVEDIIVIDMERQDD